MTDILTRFNAVNLWKQGYQRDAQPFDHMVYHFVLTYSNWKSVSLCPSGSFEALSDGMQNAL